MTGELTRRRLVARLGGAAGVLTAGAAWPATTTGPPEPFPAVAEGITLAAGRYAVLSNLTVRADVMVLPGATIDIAAGRSLTFEGDFQAPVGLVFTGTGRVDLNRSRAVAAHPEWWGAAPNDSMRDSLPALRACLAAHPVVLLGAGDYFISKTWVIEQSHRRIWGAGDYWHGPNQATRIVVTNGRDDTIRIGSEAPPAAGVNAFVQSVDLRWFELGRSAPPIEQATGLAISNVLNCVIERVSSVEHAIGFSIVGAVRTFLRDCLAFRSVPAGPGAVRSFRGFYLDGRSDIGLAGGNGSLTLADCGASVGGAPKLDDSVGALLTGGYADTYLSGFETSACSTGIRVDGKLDALTARQAKTGQANLHIRSPILDGFDYVGLELGNLGSHAVIDVADPYFGAAPGALAALFVRKSTGMIAVTGGQAIGWGDAEAGGNTIGLFCQDAAGLDVAGLKILGHRRPVALERCSDFRLSPMISNPGHPASQAAITLVACQRGRLMPSVRGSSGAFAGGVTADADCAELSVETVLIQRSSLVPGGTKVSGSARVVDADTFGS